MAKCDVCSKETYSKATVHKYCIPQRNILRQEYAQETFLITKEEALRRYEEAVRRIQNGEDCFQEKNRMWAMIFKEDIKPGDTTKPK